jgi:hypothetical protein
MRIDLRDAVGTGSFVIARNRKETGRNRKKQKEMASEEGREIRQSATAISALTSAVCH